MSGNLLMLQLERQPVLTTEQIHTLRSYILDKFNHRDSKEHANILANTIHSILDNELQSLSVDERPEAKKNILELTVTRPHFEISGLDVFKGVVMIRQDQSQGIARIKSWLFDYVETKRHNPSSGTHLRMTGTEALHAFDTYINAPYEKQMSKALSSNQNLKTVNLTDMESSSADYNQVQFEKLKDQLENATTKPLSNFSYWALTVSVLMTSQAALSHLPPADLKGLISDQPAQYMPAPLDYHYEKLTQFDQAMQLTLLSDRFGKETNIPLAYRPVSLDELSSWLQKKHSLLAKPEHLSALDDAAHFHNIDVLLLVAIVGQEQGFVPLNHPQSKKIINNPFNVFGSWQRYNTSIDESAMIAGRTVVRLLKDCPSNSDAIQWINRGYAEDPNWHKGVRSIYNQLQKDLR